MKLAAQHDYLGFVAKEMQFRRSMHYPPFSVLTNLVAQSEDMGEAAGWAAAIGRWFAREKPAGVKVLGPAAAPLAKLRRVYRFHLVVKAERRAEMNAALRGMLRFVEEQGIPRRGLVVDVDAVSLM